MTRYLRVRETLAREIAEGLYPVGERFPTDQELCARFEVSRHTVREALRHLQQEGVLARQRGAGTVVAAQAPPPYVQTFASLGELDNYAAETFLHLLAEGVVVAREQLARQLDQPEGSRWLRFAGLRYRREDPTIPLCWTEVLLAEPLIADRDALRAAEGPIYDRVRQVRGLTAEAVDQQMTPTLINKEMGELLNCEEGTPALLVRRTYLDASGAPFEISLSLHPGDRYVSSTRLTRRRSVLPI